MVSGRLGRLSDPGPQAPLEAPVEDARNEKGAPCIARLQITLCRAAETSEVLPLAVAIALLSEHVPMLSDAPEQEATHHRAYGATQRSAQGYRNAIGAAAAFRLLQPVYREREKSGICHYTRSTHTKSAGLSS
jgi:hypothetical protein